MNNYGSTNKRELFRLVVRLSLPSMWAQVSSVVMQYIDAAMLGHLNADAAAAAGVVASATWLFGGLCAALYAVDRHRDTVELTVSPSSSKRS